MLNIEFKTRWRRSPEAWMALVERLFRDADRPFITPQPITQEDIYFNVRDGRLKLRSSPGQMSELIFYRRINTADIKPSSYERIPLPDHSTAVYVFSSSLGIYGTVRKTRLVSHFDTVRLHFDAVEGLGYFMECEVVLTHGESEQDGRRLARRIQDHFAIAETQLLAESYIDLLVR